MTINLTRRHALISGGLAALATAALPTVTARPVVAAEAARTTVVLSPHQDDEVVRLSHYAVIAADRGDRMILVQVTDGSATAVGSKLGLTPAQVTDLRNTEQRVAWDWLTSHRGEIVHLGLPDGKAKADAIYNGVRAALGPGTLPGVEVYVATWHHDRPLTVSADKHVDHIATVMAARRLSDEGVVVRFAIHPTAAAQGSTPYRVKTTEQALRVEGAVNAYQVIGRRSTKNLDLVTTTSNRVSR